MAEFKDIKETIGLYQELTKKTDDIIKNIKEEIRLEKLRLEVLKTSEERNRSIILIKEKEIEIEERALALREEILNQEIKRADEISSSQKLEESGNKKEIKSLQDKSKLLEEIRQIEDLAGQIAKKKELLELDKESLASIESIQGTTESLIESLTGIGSNWKNTLWGKMANSTRLAGGFSAALSNMGKGITKTLSLSNLLGSSIMKVEEATVHLIAEQQEALSQFNKITAAAGEYNDAIIDVQQKNINLGISTSDVSEAFAVMGSEVSAFSSLSNQTKKELAGLSATFQKVGISSDIFAQNIEISNKMLGMSIEQSAMAQREIFSTAKSLGVIPAVMARNFLNAIPSLTAFGDKAVDKFKTLSTVSKATGIEVNKILNIVEQFDTFEGAASAVGKLNAILGGNFLDSMQLIQETDPTERMTLMRDAVLNAGLSFDSMSYYQRKAISSALGLENVGQLQQVMLGNWEELSAATEKDAIKQEELNNIAIQAQSVFDKLKNIMNAFAVNLNPVVDKLKAASDWILDLNKSLGGKLIPYFIGGTASLLAITKVFSIFNFSLFKSIGLTKALGTSVTSSLSGGVVRGSSSMASAIPTILAFGAAIALAGVGIGTAAYGISGLAKSFSTLNVQQISYFKDIVVLLGVSLLGITVAIGAFSAIAGASAIPLLAFGAAITLIGGGVMLASIGISKMIGAMGSLSDVSKFMNSNIFTAAAGIVALSVGFTSLSVSLALIKTSDLVAISNLFGAISKITNETASSLANVSASIKEIISSIDKLPKEKAITFAATTAMIAAVPAPDAVAVENIKQLTSSAVKYTEVQEALKGTREDKFANIIQNVSNTNTSTQNVGGNRTIVLQLDGRVLKQFVVDVMEQQLNPRKI